MIGLQRIKALLRNDYRTYKNFGHKREPIPVITTLWHGFLTFTLIGLCLEWKKIGSFIFGDNNEKNIEPSVNKANEVNPS